MEGDHREGHSYWEGKVGDYRLEPRSEEMEAYYRSEGKAEVLIYHKKMRTEHVDGTETYHREMHQEHQPEGMGASRQEHP